MRILQSWNGFVSIANHSQHNHRMVHVFDFATDNFDDEPDDDDDDCDGDDDVDVDRTMLLWLLVPML